jgi:hypothetical protein
MKYPATLEWVGDELRLNGVAIAYVLDLQSTSLFLAAAWNWGDTYSSRKKAVEAIERYFGINTKEKE